MKGQILTSLYVYFDDVTGSIISMARSSGWSSFIPVWVSVVWSLVLSYNSLMMDHHHYSIHFCLRLLLFMEFHFHVDIEYFLFTLYINYIIRIAYLSHNFKRSLPFYSFLQYWSSLSTDTTCYMSLVCQIMSTYNKWSMLQMPKRNLSWN